MNVNAIKSMENFAKQVLMLPENKQNEFFEGLKEILSEDEVLTLKKCVGIYHIMTNETLYKAVEKSLAEEFYKEFNAHRS
jgi:hypothetical protein